MINKIELSMLLEKENEEIKKEIEEDISNLHGHFDTFYAHRADGVYAENPLLHMATIIDDLLVEIAQFNQNDRIMNIISDIRKCEKYRRSTNE